MNEELIQKFVNFLQEDSKEINKIEIDEEKKIKSAYALNMCTVSVSQIIDYKDINVLEQEYEAVLNNLNLESIVKDAPLREIIKRILDTVTFFKIQEGEKKFIDKEYQNKMKNAIWSAVPNFGLIVAGGNPLTMAVSLISQIGIGYMNYRRNKNEYGLEKERKEWELQKTAIDQFNALRRELFDTAWRLAETYNFPDEYRLTEKQIKQYDEILLDDDEVRKFERLESIKDNFKAYPPFWYFIGNSANAIANNGLFDKETSLTYQNIALKYFEKFEQLNEYSILRNDQIASSCALEHIDILLTREDCNIEVVNKLLAQAIKFSGNANDILQLCAITYLRINKVENAENILRILVNEDYNAVINAQLLSSIYVKQRNRADYNILASRVAEDYLYPMPEDDSQDLESIDKEFTEKLKNVLKIKFEMLFKSILKKYSVEWNKLTSVFDYEEEYEESFFYDTPKANSIRISKAINVLTDEEKKSYYLSKLRTSNYQVQLLDILNRLFSGILSMSVFSLPQITAQIKDEVTSHLNNSKDIINNLQQDMTDGNFGIEDYKRCQSISLNFLVERSMNALLNYIYSKIENSDSDNIRIIDAQIMSLCVKEEIPIPEIRINDNNASDNFSDSYELFGPEIFGLKAIRIRENMKFMVEMTTFIKDKLQSFRENENVSIFFRGEMEFGAFFQKSIFHENLDIEQNALAIFSTSDNPKTFLIFTNKGIVNVYKDKIKFLTKYEDVELKDNTIIIYRNFKYKTKNCNLVQLFGVIKELSKKFICGIGEKIDYITEKLTGSMLSTWFKSSKYCDDSNVAKFVAIPSADLLEHMGYCVDTDINDGTSLLQFMFDKETGFIVKIRLIKYESIDSVLEAKILEKGTLEIIN